MIKNAFSYKQWADKRTLDAVALVNSSEYPREHAYIRQQLNHMSIVEDNFKARLSGNADPHKSSNTDAIPSLKVLCNRIEESNSWYKNHSSNLTTKQLAEIVTFAFVDGKRGSMSRQEILFHVITHGSYHRGAIGHALDIAGNLRPADTYTHYIHGVEPQRRI